MKHQAFFSLEDSENLRLGISCESSARQRIHMKHQALFSSKDESKNKAKRNKSVVCCNFAWLFKGLKENDYNLS